MGKCHFVSQNIAESDANAVSSLHQTAFQAISLPWELETSSVFFLVFSPYFYILLQLEDVLRMFVHVLFPVVSDLVCPITVWFAI